MHNGSIFVDGNGGDNQRHVLAGVLKASRQLTTDVIIIGDKPLIEDVCREVRIDQHSIEMIDSPINISMDAKIDRSIVRVDSSMKVAAELARKNNGGFFSCGNTAAMYMIANLIAERIDNTRRPGLAVPIANKRGGATILMDAGGMVDCQPDDLVGFTMMASAYCQAMYNKRKPRIALLSNGSEPSKGNKLTLATYDLLSSMEGIEFCGNAEGTDILSGKFDAIIADGMLGNVALKSLEGTALRISDSFKDYLESHPWMKLPASLLRPMFTETKRQLDSREQGGAIMLGCKVPFVKGHGSSDSLAAMNGMKYLWQVMISDIVDAQKEKFQKDTTGIPA